MAEVVISFTDADQNRMQEILIDKDEDAALKFVSDLADKIKGHPGHACGPKVV